MALVAAVMWAVAQQLGWPVWTRALLAAVAAAVVIVTPEIRQRRAQADADARNLRKFESATLEGHIPLVRDVGLEVFRVHDASKSVPYVARDAEAELGEALRARAPVLIVGHSMSGKSRLAAERIKASFPFARLLVPASTQALRAIVDDGAVLQDVVIFFDDFERYLKGDNSLDLSFLNQLLGEGAIIVATIRRNALNAFRPTNQDAPAQWVVVQRFRHVPLARKLTDAEERLARTAITDRATLDAIERYGLAEYLGGGPPAVDRFEDGEVSNPVGYALVRAAVDWRRAGLVRLISGDNLRRGMLFYLEDRPEVRTDEPAVQEGLAWATERINETVGLLGMHESRTQVDPESHALSYEAFDYLVDVIVDQNRESKDQRFPIPVGLWTMVDAAATPAEQSDVVMASARYFVPRPRVTAAVANWLTHTESPSGGLLITGSPGSGKSAVMFQVRAELPNLFSGTAGATRDSLAPRTQNELGAPAAVLLSLFGCKVGDLKTALAAELELPLPPMDVMREDARGDRMFINFLLAELAVRGNQTVLLLDGLDEAHDPQAITDFLGWLVSSSSDLPLWTIVSSRRMIASNLGSDWTTIDLDSEPFSDYDLASFVREKLLQVPGSPVAGNPEMAEQATAWITQQSGNSPMVASMLVDQLFTRGLTSSVEHRIAERASGAPTSLIELIQEILDRLGLDRDDAVAILKVLAESDVHLTAQELMESALLRGTVFRERREVDRIMSRLSGLVDVIGEHESKEQSFRFAHVAIREAFLMDQG